MRCRADRGFTLAELLVAVAIIALLAGIAVPVYGRSRRRAWEATCTLNLRQLAIAWRAYYDDWDGPPATLATIREPYVQTAALFHCPADPDPNGQAKSGSVAGLENDGIDPSSVFPIGVTYAYDCMWAVPTWHKTIWRALELRPTAGIIGCPCHGDHVPVPRGGTGPTSFTGLVLRARPDGSVIRARQDNSDAPYGQSSMRVLYGHRGGAGMIVYPPTQACIEYRKKHCPETLGP